MARNYYCLVAGLPDIVIDQGKLSFTIPEFKNELFEVMHPDDYRLIELLFLSFDNDNLLNMLLKKDDEFNHWGKYSKDEIEEGIKEPETFEDYLKFFIEEFKESSGTDPSKNWENYLTGLYYNYINALSNQFLNDWLLFDGTLQNILVAYNCRKHDLPPDDELVGEGDIVETLKKSHARDFGLSGEIDYIDKLISIIENKDLLDREKSIDLLRWNYLDELTTFKYFSVEVVISYMIKLLIVDRWKKLDKETGEELFARLLDDLKTSYEFPAEFIDK